MTLVAGAALLAGCASVDSTMLSEDTAIISAWGMGLEDQPNVVRSALMEAAKLTRAHRYRYFVVVTSEDLSTTGVRTVHGQTFANETAHNRTIGTTQFNAPEYSGATYTTLDSKEVYVRLHYEVMIRMYQAGEIDPAMEGVWNPDAILDTASSQP